MDRRQYLQIPGPTNIPDRILRSLSQPLINHRGREFEELLKFCEEGLKEVFRTKNDIILFPSSGSGALESAVVNLLSPGDTIAAACHGVFSERVAKIAENFGVNVIRIEADWGKAIKAEDIRRVLDEDKEHQIKAVYVPQNETTSGIQNDIESIGRTMKESGHKALLVVDAISSMACLPFENDLWNVDVCVTASQKGFMLPPGLSIVSINDRGWQAYEKSTMPKWYWDYAQVKAKMKEGQMPYTPPTTLLFGLEESLKMLKEEGLENTWARHRLMGKAARNAVTAMGLELFAEPGYESDALTAFYVPDGLAYKDIAGLLKDRCNVVVGGGLQRLQGKIVRIGHMGAIDKLDVYAVMGALEMVLYELGYKVELGTAAAAMAKTFLTGP